MPPRDMPVLRQRSSVVTTLIAISRRASNRASVGDGAFANNWKWPSDMLRLFQVFSRWSFAPAEPATDSCRLSQTTQIHIIGVLSQYSSFCTLLQCLCFSCACQATDSTTEKWICSRTPSFRADRRAILPRGNCHRDRLHSVGPRQLRSRARAVAVQYRPSLLSAARHKPPLSLHRRGTPFALRRAKGTWDFRR